MSYANKQLVRMTWKVDLTAASSWLFRLPYNEAGKATQGKIVNAGVMLTATVAGDQTAPTFQLGTTSDADAYVKVTIPDGTTAPDSFDVTDDTDAIISGAIPSGGVVKASITAATDAGTAAGAGYAFVDIYVW